jgi:AcrR family transcriptional regulator
MTRQTEDTRLRIVEVAYGLFYAGGFMRTGVDAIAAAAGVTKRTLYYHFDSKDALLAAVLDAQHHLALEKIQRWARKASESPENLVDGLFAEFCKWAGRPKWHGSGFTRIAMELADMPGHPARGMAKRHKAAVEDMLVEMLATSGITQPSDIARQVMVLLEGCMSLTLIHGDTAYVATAAAAARQLVTANMKISGSSRPKTRQLR